MLANQKPTTTQKEWTKHLPDDYNTSEALINYQSGFLYLKNNYIDYPQSISFETRALCNAACDFCPYPTMERKGEIMSDDLIEKIIQDMTDIPQHLPITITLARINEPFLDKRIFDIAESINHRIPNGNLVLFTNGSPLNRVVLDKLALIKRVLVLSVSFNDHRPQEYEEVMKLPYQKTVERIDELHKRVVSGDIKFAVRISRVGDGTEADSEFVAWVKERWPLFDVANYRRGDWLGKVDTLKSSIPNVGCHQWFSIHFLADGKDAFCCIDSDADYGYSNIADQHLLEIYNHPLRRYLRENILSRLDVGLCQSCPMMS